MRIGRTAAFLLLAVGPVVAVAATPEQEALLQGLYAGSPAERHAAAARLGEIGDRAATAGLAQALHDTDPDVAEAASAALWAIWQRSGRPEIDALLQRGIALMNQGRLPEAVAVFSEVIARDPDFAEGWNKRATVYYLMDELDRSLADCAEVIRRNPIHFGALSGYGLIYLKKEDLPHAVEYFERALTVNPTLTQLRGVLDQLRQLLEEHRRQSI